MAFLGLIDVTVAWAVLLAVIVLAYVLLDGFDLGMGILFLIERRCEERDTMVNSIAPVWDGNETWLVMGGGGLFAVFPLAYSVILPALYPVAHRDVAGADPARRGVRVPLPRDILGAVLVGHRVLRRIDRGRPVPGAGTWRPAAGYPCRGPRIRRRLVGLDDAVHPAYAAFRWSSATPCSVPAGSCGEPKVISNRSIAGPPVRWERQRWR